MDFSRLNCETAAEKGIEVKPRGPDGTRLKDVVIVVAGRDSKRFQEAKKAVVSDITDDGGDLTVDDITKQSFKTVALSIISWKGIQMDGKDYEHTPENAMALICDPGYTWLAEQLLSAANDRGQLLLTDADS